MSTARLLFILGDVALLAFVALSGLLQYHYGFDPYGWAAPGVESVESSNLWLARRDLYDSAVLCALVAAGILFAAGCVAKRRARLS